MIKPITLKPEFYTSDWLEELHVNLSMKPHAIEHRQGATIEVLVDDELNAYLSGLGYTISFRTSMWISKWEAPHKVSIVLQKDNGDETAYDWYSK